MLPIPRCDELRRPGHVYLALLDVRASGLRDGRAPVSQRCTDCGCRLKGEHYVPGPNNERPFGTQICQACLPPGADTFMEWMGMEYIGEAPPVLPVLMFCWCVIAAILTLVLLFHGGI